LYCTYSSTGRVTRRGGVCQLPLPPPPHLFPTTARTFLRDVSTNPSTRGTGMHTAVGLCDYCRLGTVSSTFHFMVDMVGHADATHAIWPFPKTAADHHALPTTRARRAMGLTTPASDTLVCRDSPTHRPRPTPPTTHAYPQFAPPCAFTHSAYACCHAAFTQFRHAFRTATWRVAVAWRRAFRYSRSPPLTTTCSSVRSCQFLRCFWQPYYPPHHTTPSRLPTRHAAHSVQRTTPRAPSATLLPGGRLVCVPPTGIADASYCLSPVRCRRPPCVPRTCADTWRTPPPPCLVAYTAARARRRFGGRTRLRAV